ncbi:MULTISPECIES: hypothetical protein [unclassified Streptomyces]|uniref:hypothetical protein n=1 Tax=unclassified Streptomyces TaxID=2593676 RepID=UPI002DDB65B7|nr:hypothetical protein [Streptomyces sp. NBC_01257]WRZ64771.1 hypothetical protein OG408_13125 [Streptomyces sp. NBC_01257]
MGTSRAWGRRTARRFPAALCLAATAVVGLAACEPVDGLNTASIAVTTDRTGTRALEHEGVDVRWLTCTARTGEEGAAKSSARAASPTASTRRIADVDCDGKTKSGQDITINGQVRQAVDGRCVRGDLTAKAGGRTVFRATLLGNCDAPPSTPAPDDGGGSGGGGGARPAVTVTVTVTEYPQGK